MGYLTYIRASLQSYIHSKNIYFRTRHIFWDKQYDNKI